MGKNPYNFFFLQIIDQRIVKGNSLLAPKTRKIGVGFGASFRAVYYKNIIQFKTYGTCIIFNFAAQATFGQWCLFIEKRYNKARIKHIHNNRKIAKIPHA